ncbi:MAG: hypothetical protein U0271_03800 [Polyangiaceae bacterium]
MTHPKHSSRWFALALLSLVACSSSSKKDDSKSASASATTAPPSSSANGAIKEKTLTDLGIVVNAPEGATLEGNQLEKVISNPSEAYINFSINAAHECKIDEIKKNGENVESLDGGRVAWVQTETKIKKLYVCLPAQGDSPALECSSPMVGMIGDPVPDAGLKVLWDICKSMRRIVK